MGFISSAYADTGASQEGGMFQLLILVGVFAAIFYFLMYRPQAKKTKERNSLMSALGKGDDVLISGGLMGTVVKLTDQFAIIALNNSTNVTIKRDFIIAILPKGTIKAIETK